MGEDKNINAEEKVEEKTTNNKCCNKNNTLKIVLIVIGVLVFLGIAYRVNAYWKYKSLEKHYKKQADQIQTNYLKQMDEVQKKILEQQKKQLEEMNK